nr:hypothetical protein BHI3_03850 [Bacteriovorax sp. HI3]
MLKINKIILLAFFLLMGQMPLSIAKEMITQDFISEPLSLQQKKQIEEWVTGKKIDTIVSGTINLHPNIKLPPGGELHLRLVNISSIYRPFIFKRLYNVQFPYKYQITTSDFVGGIGPQALFEPYYLEAFYYRYRADKTPRYDDSEGVVGGEAWGNPGRPYPLSFGQNRDFQLNFWWTPELFGSRFSPSIKSSPSLTSGWLYLSNVLKKKLDNVKQIEGSIYVCDKKLQLVKSTSFKIADLNKPIEWHIDLPNTVTGFISVTATAKTPDGKTVYLRGGRASPKVVINLPAVSLKIVLTTISNKTAPACTPRDS